MTHSAIVLIHTLKTASGPKRSQSTSRFHVYSAMQRRSAAAFGFLCLFLVNAAATMLGGASNKAPDAHSDEVAKFAVSQLNSKANFPKQGTLQFTKVVSAKTQVVAGTNHILVIEAADEAGPKTVEVTVWEKLPSNVKENDLPMELTNYKLAGPVAEGNEQWTKAAQQGVAQLNQRSNSLFPYQLLDVLSATPANDGSSHTELLVAVKRGDKQETFALTVKPAADEHYSLVKFTQKAEGPSTS